MYVCIYIWIYIHIYICTVPADLQEIWHINAHEWRCLWLLWYVRYTCTLTISSINALLFGGISFFIKGLQTQLEEVIYCIKFCTRINDWVVSHAFLFLFFSFLQWKTRVLDVLLEVDITVVGKLLKFALQFLANFLLIQILLNMLDSNTKYFKWNKKQVDIILTYIMDTGLCTFVKKT